MSRQLTSGNIFQSLFSKEVNLTWCSSHTRQRKQSSRSCPAGTKEVFNKCWLTMNRQTRPQQLLSLFCLFVQKKRGGGQVFSSAFFQFSSYPFAKDATAGSPTQKPLTANFSNESQTMHDQATESSQPLLYSLWLTLIKKHRQHAITLN